MSKQTEKKDIGKSLWIVVAVVLVIAAAAMILLPKLGGAAEPTTDSVTYSIEVTLSKEEVVYSGEVTAEEGESLFDVMVENITQEGGVEYSDGAYGAYITSICGNSENAAESMFWTFTINGEQVMVGVSECYPADGDEVVFDLSVLTW
ncbi:MAG: DUF4430 domain-containing protein [Clostridia bacterium]|nr:DUF4430 domain-containing protein [Clostridia bacterium]